MISPSHGFNVNECKMILDFVDFVDHETDDPL